MGQPGHGSDFVALTWPSLSVCRQGYEAIKRHDERGESGELLLVTRCVAVKNGVLVVPTPATFRQVSPIDNKTLLGKFMDIGGVADIVRFASEYGFLGIGTFPYEDRLAEFIDQWLWLVDTVRAVSVLVHSVAQGVVVRPQDREVLVAGRPPLPMSDHRFDLGQRLIDAAAMRNASVGSRETWCNVLPQVLINEWISFTVTTAFDFETGAFWAVPKCLAGVMWMQLADDLSARDINLRKCRGCGVLFRPTRPNMIYCPHRRDACRKKAQRKRKNEKPASPNKP